MARPAKPTATAKSHLTKHEIDARKAVEEANGGDLPDNPPSWMMPDERKVYRWLVKALKSAGFLGNLDSTTVHEACFVIAQLYHVNELLREDRTNFELDRMRQSYSKQFLQYANALGMSPQARAKLGTLQLSAKKDAKDPLMVILND